MDCKEQLPGLLVTSSSGDIGQAADIHIRGVNGSLNAQSRPLILLDNVEIPDLMMVNPNDVESISVLKDAASAFLFMVHVVLGGVILITTKKGEKENHVFLMITVSHGPLQ